MVKLLAFYISLLSCLNSYSSGRCYGQKILIIQTNIDLDNNIAGTPIKCTDFKASIYMNPNFETDLPDEFCIEYTNPLENVEQEFMYYAFTPEQLFEGFSLTIPVLGIELVKLQSTHQTDKRWPLTIEVPAEFNRIFGLNGMIKSYQQFEFLLEQKGSTGLDWDLSGAGGRNLRQINIDYVKRPNGMPHYFESEPEIIYWREIAPQTAKPVMVPGSKSPFGPSPY